MAAELELKAVVADPAALRARLASAGAVPTFAGRMRDHRYDRAGELAPRDEVLRVRTLQAAGQPARWELAWKGPTSRSADGYKLREEHACVVGGDTSPSVVLEALGYVAIHRVDREVEVYQLGGAMVRLETYPRMDVLLEVEGEPEAIERAIAALALPRASFTAEPLSAFVARYEARDGRAAVVAESST